MVRLETRPANIEGTGEVTQRDLVRNALRMRPDRIIVGEVRGAEALDMLQAMNTGHEGSLTTVHANTPRDALLRLENMIGMAEPEISATRPRASRSPRRIDVVIQVARLTDGRRKLISLQEITGMEGEVITMQEIFTFERRGIDANGNVLGSIEADGPAPLLRRDGAARRHRASRPTSSSLGGPPKEALCSFALYVLVFIVPWAARARGRVRAAARAPRPGPRAQATAHAIAPRVAQLEAKEKAQSILRRGTACGSKRVWPVSRDCSTAPAGR